MATKIILGCSSPECSGSYFSVSNGAKCFLNLTCTAWISLSVAFRWTIQHLAKPISRVDGGEMHLLFFPKQGMARHVVFASRIIDSVFGCLIVYKICDLD